VEKLNLLGYQTKDKRQKTKVTKAFVKESSKTLTTKDILQCDLALGDLNDLIDPAFKNWFCKCYYQLGGDVMHRLASVARQEAKTNPKNYFGRLVKVEMSRLEA
jgi:hypothetical protein